MLALCLAIWTSSAAWRLASAATLQDPVYYIPADEDADARFDRLTRAVLSTSDVGADPGLVRDLAYWLQNDVRRLAPIPNHVSIRDFVDDRAQTEAPIRVVQALLQGGPPRAVSAAALLLTLMARAGLWPPVCAHLTLVVLARGVRQGSVVGLRLDTFFPPILTALGLRSPVLRSVEFVRRLLTVTCVSLAWRRSTPLHPMTAGVWRVLFRIWSAAEFQTVALFAAADLRSRTLWGLIFVEAALLRSGVGFQSNAPSDDPYAARFASMPAPFQVQLVVELSVRAVSYLRALLMWFSAPSLNVLGNRRFRDNPAACNALLRYFPTAGTELDRNEIFWRIVKRIPPVVATNLIVDLNLVARLRQQRSIALVRDDCRFLGCVHYHLLLREDCSATYRHLSVSDSATVAYFVAAWCSQSVDQATSPNDDVIALVSQAALSRTRPQSETESARNDLILELIGRGWPIFSNHADVIQHLLVFDSSLTSCVHLVDALFQCSSAIAQQAPALLRALLLLSIRGQLRLADYHLLRDRLWSNLFAEDQAELKRCYPDLFGFDQVRSVVTGDDLRQFISRIDDDNCKICLEPLLSVSQDEAALLSGLYKMPCRDHFLHRDCYQLWRQANAGRRLEVCFICGQSLTRPPPIGSPTGDRVPPMEAAPAADTAI